MIQAYRTAIYIALLAAALVLSACNGGGNTTVADVIDQVSGQVEDAVQPVEGSSVDSINPAKATVSARTLRVRGTPSANGEIVGGIKEGQVYDVIGLSSDGEWIQLAIPGVPGGKGWVSANFVSVQGSITNASITEAPTPAPAPASAPASAAPAAAPQSLNLIAVGPGTATIKTEGVRLRVRGTPSTDAEIVGYVYQGELYQVLETTADGRWTKIGGRPGTDNTNGGWVASEYLTLN